MADPRISRRIHVFHGRHAPEEGTLVGYGAIHAAFRLEVPMPERLVLISTKKRQYENGQWLVLTPRHAPADRLHAQLAFAIKYEGIDLSVLKALFDRLGHARVLRLVNEEPHSRISRKLWFLFEWFTGKQLKRPDLDRGNYVALLDDSFQFSIAGTRSSRHRIINNLPGIPDFCPLVRRTPKLEAFMTAGLLTKKEKYLGGIRKDVMQRAAAFLLLKDSKASFAIEGEQPRSQRAARWGNAIGQAGRTPLSKQELERLQQVVIESSRFTPMGYRKQGGFVGEHDRATGEPLPDHISARWQDVDQLMNGLFATHEKVVRSDMDAVVAAAMIGFGFVFIHPFVDGNGRLHRYLIHHVLASKGYHPPGMIFPVSAAILDHLNDYRNVLEAYSRPLLDHIEWRITQDNNVEVRNATIDLYRYFDATAQAEFLYEQVRDTIDRIIPEEVEFLLRYDELKRFLEDAFEMPDKTADLLIRFLVQGNGTLGARARAKEFKALKATEVKEVEAEYKLIFGS